MTTKHIKKAGLLAGLVLAGLSFQVQAAPLTYIVGLVTATLGYDDGTGGRSTATQEYSPAAGVETVNDYAAGTLSGSDLDSTLDYSNLAPYYVDDGVTPYANNSFTYTLDNTNGQQNFNNTSLDMFVNLLFMSPQAGYMSTAYSIGNWTLLLQDLLRDNGFIPVSGSALSFESILTICNDILINERKAIIEFGCGISTLVIASLIKRKGLSCRFVSVEGNAAWRAIIGQHLLEAGTADAVELIHAPVIPHRLAIAGNSWYDVD